jgi:hypothetical protein
LADQTVDKYIITENNVVLSQNCDEIILYEDPFKFQLLYVIFYMHMTGYIWLRLGTNGWLLQTVHKLQDSKKGWETLDWLGSCQLLNEDTALYRVNLYTKFF